MMLVTNPVNPDPRVQREASTLSKKSIDVNVVGFSDLGCTYNQIEQDGYVIERLPNPGQISRFITTGWIKALLKIIRYYIEVFLRMPKILKGVSVIHCHDFDTLPLGYFLSKIGKRKLVYDSHEVYSGMFAASVPHFIETLVNALEKKLCKSVEIITVGKILGDRFKRFTGKDPWIIRNTPSIQWQSTAIKDEEKFIIGYVGGLLEDRCIEETIEAFHIFSKNHDDVQLRIAGFGPLTEKIKSLVDRSDADIKFYGKIPYTSVADYIKRLDISLILFSKKSQNNFYSSPNKLFESILVGVPVLASNFGELGWLVRSNKLGFTTNPDDPNDISKSFEKIYKARQSLVELSYSIQERGQSQFTWEHSQVELIKLYRKILHNN